MSTHVRREHCIQLGTSIVCAICESPYGDDHEPSCERYQPEPPIARRACSDCGQPVESQYPYALFCNACATAPAPAAT